MNKTLLLIICDFLLLNLLALTRWEKVGPIDRRPAPVPALGANAVQPQNNDLLDAMRSALEDERATRDQLTARLQTDVRSRDSVVTQLEQQRQRLEAKLQESEKSSQEVQKRLQAASTQAAQTAKSLELAEKTLAAAKAESERQQQTLAASLKAGETEKRQLLETLARQQQETERQQAALLALQKERRESDKQLASLNAAVIATEAEKKLLSQNVSELKQQVTLVRQEKDRVQEQTATLASGVSALAAKSGELRAEIRENTPINANILFSDYLSNRVHISVGGIVTGIFGPAAKQRDCRTILVSESSNVLAVLHVGETPINLRPPVTGIEKIIVSAAANGTSVRTGPLYAVGIDPRVFAVPIDQGQARAAGINIYAIAKNPFKFSEAVLISRGGKAYGDVEFKLDPKNPDYVRMKSRVFSRLFGEFAPSAGDIVLSKTGEFLGIMVNDTYCAVVRSFIPAPAGILDAQLSKDAVIKKLEQLSARVESMPLPLR